MAKTPSPPQPTERKWRWKRWALGTYRLAIILAALACLRKLPRDTGQLDPARILTSAKATIPGVLSVGDPTDGLFPLLSETGEPAGWATSTFPQAENIQGYSGSSELLVIFGSDRKVKSVSLLSSSDTDGHVEKIRKQSSFWSQWHGKAESTLGAPGSPIVVSGATLSSEAMARGVAARFGAEGMDQWFPLPLTLEDVVKWFPSADLIAETGDAGTYHIEKDGDTLGTVLRSSRMGISARGFNGTSDVIVALDPSGKKVLGVGFLGSRDNEPYISDVRDEVKYTDGFAGKSIAGVIAEDITASPSLFTSGASYTNQAVVESVREMLRRHIVDEEANGFPWKTSLAFAWIALGMFFGLSKRYNKPAWRIGFAVVSVAAGIALGWMVSQDQLIGWGSNGFGLRGMLPLLTLTAVALVVPAFTGKNVYCNRICPHGAAQTLLGKVIKKRFALPGKLHSVLTRLPWLTLIVIWILAFVASGIPFAYFEPFETWSSGFVAFIPAVIFTIGLVAALFLPQSYCHYGCPTGALLKFLTYSPTAWTRRDTVAALLIAAALFRILL